MSMNAFALLDHTDGPEPRALPANVEAEAALLGALLIENGAFDSVADIMRPSDFYEPVHQRIYEAALSDVMAGKVASPTTLKGRFDADEGLKELGGTTYLAQLTADGQGLLAMRELACLIREAAKRRAMVTAGRAFVAAALDQNIPLPAVADMLEGTLEDGPEEGIIEADAGTCVQAHLRSMAEGTGGISCARIPAFDQIVGSLRDKHFVLVAARPGMGKTALACSYAVGVARQGHGVLFVSLEMSGEELGGRMAADMCYGLDGQARVAYGAIASGNLDDRQRGRVTRAAGELCTMPLTIIDAPSITPGRLARLVRRHKRRMEAKGTPLRLVIVDYLQRMTADRERQKNYEEVSEISRALKDIAKSNGVAIMALAQLNRDVERRGDKRPQLADLRDSGQLEQDADTVVFLLRQEYYHRQAEPDPDAPEWPLWKDSLERMTGEIEFIVPKRRGGETGSAKGAFHAAFQAVR